MEYTMQFEPSFASSSSIDKWTAKMKRRRRMTWTDWIQTLFPCYRWLRTYKWSEYLRPDLISGATVAVMLIPQSMSYAKLAGLHPIYGLYSGFVPVFAYAIFGSSHHISVGPVSLISLLVSSSLANIVDSSEETYADLATLLAFMVGVLECVMGLLRLGWLIRFISRSVIAGFTTASVVVISLSQAEYLFGYDIESNSRIVPLAKSIIAGADKFSWPPFAMGSITLAILAAMKHLGKSSENFRFLRAAGPLTAVVLSTIVIQFYHPPSITLIGKIPQGLPKLSVPKGFAHAKSLIPTMIMIAGVGILESVGIAKALAAKNGNDVDTNQELFGLGVSNLAGSFFQAYPATGAFSRTAVNCESGVKTGLSGIVTGIITGCTLLFMTPLFECVPQCALAAIVISAVAGVVDLDEVIFLWRVDKKQFAVWFITCVFALFLGVQIGVLIGVGTSLAIVIHNSADPRIARLGRLPGTTAYRNIEQYSEAYACDGIVIVHIDSPIYFANASYVKDRLREYEAEAARVCFIIIEMTPVPYVDGYGVQALQELHREFKSRNVQIAIANPNREVTSTLVKAGAADVIGREWHFVRTHDAVRACLRHVGKLNACQGTQSSARIYDDYGSLMFFLEGGVDDNDDGDIEKPLLEQGP